MVEGDKQSSSIMETGGTAAAKSIQYRRVDYYLTAQAPNLPVLTVSQPRKKNAMQYSTQPKYNFELFSHDKYLHKRP